MIESGVILQSTRFLLEPIDKSMEIYFSYLMNERRREKIKRSSIPIVAIVIIAPMESEYIGFFIVIISVDTTAKHELELELELE